MVTNDRFHELILVIRDAFADPSMDKSSYVPHLDALLETDQGREATPLRPTTVDQPVTDKQLKMIGYLCSELQLSPVDVGEIVADHGASVLLELNRRQASAVIDDLQARTGVRR